MSFPPRPPFEIVRDVRSTTWIDERLIHTNDRGRAGWLVGELMPSGFEAHARIFHPAHEVTNATEHETQWVTVRWAQIAGHRGKVVHPQMELESLIDDRDAFDYDHWRAISWLGELFPPYEWLEGVECLALAAALAPFSSDPEPWWFWLWDGYGDLGAEIEQISRAMIHPGEVIRLPGTRPPRLGQLALRHYLVFRGPRLGLEAWFRWRDESPNYWYPNDRAWVVATEIDGFSTYVGGTRDCIDAVLASPRLEALACQPADHFGGWGDGLNGSPSPRA